jgi:O-antigen/teichoic acid export membrane protein
MPALTGVWQRYAKTIAAEGAGLVLGAVVPAVVARRFGPDGFGKYSVVFELLAVLQPVLLVGLGVATLRHIASRPTAADGERPESVLIAAACVEVLVVGAVAAALILSSGEWTEVVFGDDFSEGGPLLALLLTGSCAMGIVNGYLRGRFWTTSANALLFTYTGLAPVAALAFTSSVTSYFTTLGALWLVAALLAARVWALRPLPSVPTIRSLASELTRFGARRIPGELALFALFSLPTLIAARNLGVEIGGHVAFAVSVVTISSALFVPISLILLPAVADLIARDEIQQARDHLARLIPVVLLIALLVTAVIEVTAPWGVRVYLGPDFSSAVTDVRIIALAIPGYAIFLTCRGALDAIHHKAVSLRWAILSLAVFLAVTAFVNQSSSSIGLAFTIAVTFLGLVSWRSMNSSVRALVVAPKSVKHA